MKILILSLLAASSAIFSLVCFFLTTACGTAYRTLFLGQNEEEQLRDEKPKK